MTEIVLAFGPFANDERVADLEAAFPDAVVHSVPYAVDHEVGMAVAAEPGSPGARARLPQPSDELRRALATAEVVLALDPPAGLAELAPALRLVQTVGSGIGQWWVSDVDPEQVVICNGAGVSAPAISEWVIAQVLRVLKRIDRVAEQQRERQWGQVFGDQLAGRRMAIVGLGEIGGAVAVRAAAMEVEVHGVRRTPGEPPPGVAQLHHPDDLLDVLATCDLVVACLPGSAATQDVFDAGAFAAMPRGAIFVNVGRGGAVDEAALVDALRSGHLRAACLDVTREEPVPSDSELWDCPRLHLSPHSAAAPGALLDGVWRRFVANIAALRDGGPFDHRVRSFGD